MNRQVTIQELEETINCYRRAQPSRDGVVSRPVKALANLYGWMIWSRLTVVNLDTIPRTVRDATQGYLGSKGK